MGNKSIMSKSVFLKHLTVEQKVMSLTPGGGGGANFG